MTAPTLLDGQEHHEPQEHHAVEAPTSPPAMSQAVPITRPLAGNTDNRTGQSWHEAHPSSAGAVPSSPQATVPANSKSYPPAEPNVLDGQPLHETHPAIAVEAPTTPPGHLLAEAQAFVAGRGPFLADPFLGILAATVDDLEGNRKALANRYRQLTRATTDIDGRMRGLGLSDASPDVAIVRTLLAAIGGEKLDGSGGIEHQAVLKLSGRMRKHPLWKSWGIHQKGVGEKQLARLLASVGDPYWNDLHDRPRTVSELWAYCGFSVVRTADQGGHAAHSESVGGTAQKKTRGQKINWSGDARMRAWNISGSCLKAQAGYADVYYEAREKYAEATHSAPCARCGPAGKPAPEGSPLSDGHKHARALRIVSKEILRDLWIAAKVLHETPPADQATTANATASASAGGQK